MSESTAIMRATSQFSFPSVGPGDDAIAVDLQQRRLAEAEEAHGPASSFLLEPLGELAHLHLCRRRYPAAELLSRRALAVARTAKGEEHPATLRRILHLAFLLYCCGRRLEAVPLLRDALVLSHHLNGSDPADAVVSQHLLYVATAQPGEKTQVAQCIEERVALFRKCPERSRSSDLAYGSFLCDFGVFLKNEMADFTAAESHYRWALELSPDDSVLCSNYALLLTCCFQQHAEARRYYELALAGPVPNAVALSNYAFYKTHVERDYTSAAALFQQALHQDAQNGAILGNHASLLMLTGQNDRARRTVREAFAVGRRLPCRLLARPLFCQAALNALDGADYALYLGRLKTLLRLPVQRVRWAIDALMEYLDQKLPAGERALFHAMSGAINAHHADAALVDCEPWSTVTPVPLDTDWPAEVAARSQTDV